MNFWVDFWKISLRAQFASVRNWALLLLLPLLTFGAVRLLPADEVSAPVQVGVVLPEEGGGAFWRYLEERSGLVVEFRAASLDQARRQVAAGQWDCALVLPKNFSRRLEDRDLEGLFTVLISPASAVYPLVQETAASCAARCVSPGIAENYLLEQKIVPENEIVSVRPRLEENLLEQDRVLVTLETADGSPLDPLALADRGMSRLLAGLTAILLAVWALCTAMDLGRWLETPFARRLIPLRGAARLSLTRLGAAMAPALAFGGLALLALEDPVLCILALVPYLLFWGSAALALARWRGAWAALPVLMPFVPVAGLILSTALVDLSTLFPVLGPVVRWSPVTLYLQTCAGHWGDGLILAAAGTGILALLWVLEQKKPSP